MIKIKKGDLLKIRSCEDSQYYYYTGIIDRMNYNGIPCVFLATDLQNRNTYARFSQQKLAKYGYCL
jgi:hypothetical protein